VKLIDRLTAAWTVLRGQNPSIGVQLRPDSDLWYQHLGYQTATGLRVSPESAMRVAAVFACVRVISETVGSLPLHIYRRLPDGGKERAFNHPLYRVLHDTPNHWQTAYEFIEMMQHHLELRGNAFARIVAGPNGAIEQLIPLHPDRVSVYRMPNGKLKYQVRYLYNAQVDVYNQEEILHIRGLSSDGLVGMSTVGVGAETIGCGLAQQEFAERFFENDATPGGVMIHPKVLTDGAHKRIKDSWREYFSGSNQHGVAILEEGMTYQNIGITNKDSQLLEARQFSRIDICSMFRVPPHKIGDLSRATFSNIEQQNIEFATDSVRPRLVRFERRLNVDLIDAIGVGEDHEYFAEFQMDALLRGDLKSRYDAYATAINAGFMTRAEARTNENMNPIDGLDIPLMPLNMVTVSSDGTPQPNQPPPAETEPIAPGDETGVGAKRLEQFVQAEAERVLRKEVGQIRRAMGRSCALEKFKEEALEFYSTHAEFVRECMHISELASQLYVANNCRLFTTCTSTEQIEARLVELENQAPKTLARLALPRLLAAAPRKELQPVGGPA
jgi:HK97 family phage portal protein